jgi:hypothetical protein
MSDRETRESRSATISLHCTCPLCQATLVLEPAEPSLLDEEEGRQCLAQDGLLDHFRAEHLAALEHLPIVTVGQLVAAGARTRLVVSSAVPSRTTPDPFLDQTAVASVDEVLGSASVHALFQAAFLKDA